MKVENTDVTGSKCVKDKENNFILGDKEKRVWKAHYELLLNVEFIWDDGSLSIEPSFEGPAIKITKDMATEAVLKMKEGIVCGLSGIVIGMFNAGGDATLDVITDLINLTIKEEQIPKNWDQSTIMELWWSLRKLGVDQWLIRLVKAMYSNAKFSLQVNGSSSESFKVTVGVHQGSVLSHLLFIIMMEALSREFRVSDPWELLYANDLAFLSDSLVDL